MVWGPWAFAENSQGGKRGDKASPSSHVFRQLILLIISPSCPVPLISPLFTSGVARMSDWWAIQPDRANAASEKILALFVSLDGFGACSLATLATPLVRFLSGSRTQYSETKTVSNFLRLFVFCFLLYMIFSRRNWGHDRCPLIGYDRIERDFKPFLLGSRYAFPYWQQMFLVIASSSSSSVAAATIEINEGQKNTIFPR